MVIKSRNKRQSKHDREGKKMSRKLNWKTRRKKENSANFSVDKRRALKQTMEKNNGKVWVCTVSYGAETSGELWQTK